MKDSTILIIEDDDDIRHGVRLLLESEGFCVKEASNGNDGLSLVSNDVDLVILDIMMPGISGLETCERLRKISNVPVLFLTAKSGESDKLIGLTAGGDDYLSKPFSYSELLARVKALVRRYKVYCGKNDPASESDSMIKIGEVSIDKTANLLFVCGKRIELTDLEYRILLLLMKNPTKVFSAQAIYETVWNEPYYYTSNSTVMVHIRKLRVKIEESGTKPHIKTVWGKGYRFE